MDCHWTNHIIFNSQPYYNIYISRQAFCKHNICKCNRPVTITRKKQEIVTFYIGVYCLKINCTILSRSLPATSGAAAQGAECIRPGVNTSRRALRVFYLECAVPKVVHHMRASEASRQRSLRQLCCNELHRSYNVYSYLYIHCICITLLTENKHLCHIWGIIDTL